MTEPDDLTASERELLREQGLSLEALRARHGDCPRLDVLLASHSGVLPDETAESVAAHLRKCTFCQILMQGFAGEEFTSATAEEAYRINKRVLAADKPEAKKAKVGGGLLGMWLWKAIPATALATVAIAVFMWTRRHQPATPVVQPTATVQPTPAAPASMQWEKLPIRVQAESILVWRGNPRTAQEHYASELTAALALYKDDKFAEAADRLTKVATHFPRGVEGQLYLGVSLLKMDRHTEAIGPLQAAQALGPQQFREDATWYLALAYERAGDAQGALRELRKQCAGKSDYAARACSAAEELSGGLEGSGRK